ncbi:MAG: hypothetical protein KDE51_09705, partial [Anaerolineales bacterium]|nr:hypothetical protein [Anaerolineales bacterium]
RIFCLLIREIRAILVSLTLAKSILEFRLVYKRPCAGYPNSMNEDTVIAILIPFVFLIVFPLFWSTIVFMISLLGGWATIAERYPYREPLNPKCFSLQSGILRYMMNYNGVLKICVDDEGLYFSVLFLFRPGHTPFFVPWEEIEGQVRQHFFYKVVDFRFAQTPTIPFYIYKRSADKIVEASNGRWAYKEKAVS